MNLPISGPIALALSFFKIPVQVRDVQYTTTDGQDTQTLLGTRVINAAVDPGRSRAMERIFGGSVSDGDIGVYTHEELYFTDQYATGAAQKQSFVTYRGFNYRVEEVADWMPQAKVRVYLAKRHVKQGEVV